MAVHAIEWQISQHLEGVDMMNCIDHFLKVCNCLRDFHEVYINGVF